MAQQLILDRYRVLEQAGSGGYATVYRAHDLNLKRDVAIKVIELSESDMSQARLMAMNPRFQRDLYDENAVDELLSGDFGQEEDFDDIPGLAEARMAAQLNDTNIVTVYECVLRDNTAYVIMEYVEGKTLAELMQDSADELDIDVIASVFTSVAHALDVAHGRNILHFDIKPDNVIIDRNGVVKVTDFGLATLVDAGGHGKAGGGTIGYMPLEQLRREPLDARCDQWALASMTYEMLSGHNPFNAATLKEAEEELLEAELVLPSLCWDGLNADIDDVMFKALDLDPEQRYLSISEFADDLSLYLGDPRKGKKQLARLVQGLEPEADEAPALPRTPGIPLVDRIGRRGGRILTRVVSAVGAFVVTWLAVLNFQGGSAASIGLTLDWTAPLWGVIAIFVVIAAVKPSLGAALSFVALSAALISNGSYALGVGVLVATALWWYFVARTSDLHAIVAVLQPIGGAFGFAALAPVAAGCFLTVGQAAASALYAAFMALVFASFGAHDLMFWNVLGHAQFHATNVEAAFLETVADPMTWCVFASWILAAAVFSLCCSWEKRVLDIAGAVLACVVLVAGVCLGMMIAAADGVFALDGIALVGALIPGLIGIAAAFGSVADRVRWDESEWLD